MRDTWIDEHTGDETVARPGFEAELRAQLAKELAAPVRPSAPSSRRTPWRAVGWASVAAAAALTGVVVLAGDENDQRVAPSATSTPEVTTSDTRAPVTILVRHRNTLQVPASGGPALAPTELAAFDVLDGFSTYQVALLPDRVAIALVTNGRFDGTIVSFDLDGSRLPDTRLDVVPPDMAGLVLGGLDGTLYLETYPESENTQTTKAYVLDGDVWREVDSFFVEQNNDGVYSVTGEGLMLGTTLVIPAKTPVETDDLTVRYPGSDSRQFEVLRAADSDTISWQVTEDFENFSVPPIVQLYGGGVMFEGNSSGAVNQRYVAVLRAGEPSEFFRPNGWHLVGTDDSRALFAKVVDGSLRLGVFDEAVRSSQVDWSAGTVLDFPIGFSGVDKVLTGVNPMLGEPTADSGWFFVEPVTPGDEDCLAGMEMRVLHWGNLSVAFRKANTSDGVEGEFLWSWVVGDLRGSGFDSFREPVPAPIGPSTGLMTPDGIGMGSSIDQLQGSGEVVLSDFTNDDGTRGGYFTPAEGTDGSASRSFVIDATGTVIGFGTTQSFC